MIPSINSNCYASHKNFVFLFFVVFAFVSSFCGLRRENMFLNMKKWKKKTNKKHKNKNKSRIQISVRPNELIGSFEFDLVSVYYNKHHELYKQWVALTDVTDANEVY